MKKSDAELNPDEDLQTDTLRRQKVAHQTGDLLPSTKYEAMECVSSY